MGEANVAVVVPVFREIILPSELVSLRHLREHLSRFPIYQISPQSLVQRIAGMQPCQFQDDYFRSISAYSRLMLSREFYERFIDYEWLLVYQLDCLVFSGGVSNWCSHAYDYIGAPLFRRMADPRSGFSGGCNGGLSLRRTRAFLNVLGSTRYLDGNPSLCRDVFHHPWVEVRPSRFIGRCLKRLQIARAVRAGAESYVASYTLNEDQFWSARASYFWPAFRVAPPDTALRFAFEAAPDWCFEQSGRNVPFGAHAWQKWDPGFWEPYLTKI